MEAARPERRLLQQPGERETGRLEVDSFAKQMR